MAIQGPSPSLVAYTDGPAQEILLVSPTITFQFAQVIYFKLVLANTQMKSMQTPVKIATMFLQDLASNSTGGGK